MFAFERRFLKFVFVITIAVLCGNSSIDAGDWHGPNQLDCSECHTVHYRERGMVPLAAEGGGPFPNLLVASTVNALCLMCHDGTDTDAPDVVTPLDSVGYTDNPAGGFFANSGGAASDNAHNLGMSSPETPPGSPDSLTLDCVSCHAPHGSPNYRNLLLNPAGSGNVSDVNLTISQAVSADGPGGIAPNQVYIPSNITYQSGMSDWCNDCHTDFHGSGETGSPEPWFRHPNDQAISASTFVDYTYWTGTVTDHVPVDNPIDLTIPSADDEVFCLSCHKAHGSPNKHSLIYADGATKRSTCLQCHYGPYDTTEHGNTGTGVFRIASEPQGDCAQCHDLHASREGAPTPGGPHDYGLFASNDNNLCYNCHSLAGSNNIYQGSAAYDSSIHATDTNVYWPGPSPASKSPSDFGKCVNCHTPHGYDDGSGLVPSQAFAREENLCESCHDGSPSTIDIQFEMNKTYRHPTGSYSTRHDPSESGPGAFDNLNRHAECVDCHNPHYADSDSIPPVAPDASDRIRGVSGVSVINGSGGTVPGYSYIPSATGISYEYELCFKCHSSWTTQPGGQPDLSVLFNPNNASYHPVEAQAQNLGIDPNSFVNGWNTGNTMHCSDCHTSDNNQVRGPHGSQYNYILKRDTTISSTKLNQTIASDQICFDCHRYNTYANDNADTEQKYSRFYKKGHGFHVDKKNYPCYACHDSHGAANRPNLIVTGRSPGMGTFSQAGPGTGDKGSCNPTCHGSKDYNIQYAR